MFQITDVQIKLLLSFFLILIVTFYYINSKSFKEKNVSLIVTSFIQGLVLSAIFPKYVFYAPIMALVYYVLFYNIWGIIFLFKLNKLEPYIDENLIQSLKKLPGISHLKFKFRKYSGDNTLNANVKNPFLSCSNEYQISFGEELISKFTLEERIVVVAHEIGHILKKHFWVQIIMQSVLFVILGLVSLGLNLIALTYFKNHFVYFDYAITLIVLLVGIISINIISWRNEYDADKMAIQLTKNIKHFTSAYLKLDDEKYNNRDYGTIVNLLVYSHPLLVNRIKRANETHKDFRLRGLFIKKINELLESLFKCILKHPYIAVIVFSMIGLCMSLFFKLTMDDDAWFWFFSSIAQTLAALIALIAIFFISRVELYNSQIHNKFETLRSIINFEITNIESKYFAATDELIKSDSETLYLNLNPHEAFL